ncbi:hypothetical protein M885DRAFT_541251 [Pelagophyceae sp. CCMP2097]|nr:hypothetical protein M885DRAFT_541251 [Pelagophyceae sp. CCMP2097]
MLRLASRRAVLVQQRGFGLQMGKKKAVAKAMGKKEGKTTENKDAAYNFYRDIIDAPKRVRPRLSDEEYAKNAAIGALYNKNMRLRHQRFCAGIQTQLKLMVHATRRLPAELEAHARTLNDIPEPPLDRRYWTVTPPIPGFDPEAAEAMVEAMNPPELPGSGNDDSDDRRDRD